MSDARSVGAPSATPRRRWLRRGLAALAAMLLLLLVAALSAPWWFDARRVAALSLAQADRATGLEWSFTGEPELRWRPDPWLALPSLSARDAQGRTVMSAARLELALPWTTLRGESLRIKAVTITALDLDLDATLAWWDTQPPGDGDWPDLEGLTLTNSRVRWAAGEVDALALSLPRFATDAPMRLTLSGRVTRSAPASAPMAGTQDASDPFDVQIELDATPRAAPFRLEALHLALSGTGPVPAATASGNLQFAPWHVDLAGDIASWPAAWPALPSPLSTSASPIAFTVAQSGESALAAEATFRLWRDDTLVDARVVPAALLAWRDDAAATALPPLNAEVALPRVELEGVVLEGVSVSIDGDGTGDESMPAVEGQPSR